MSNFQQFHIVSCHSITTLLGDSTLLAQQLSGFYHSTPCCEGAQQSQHRTMLGSIYQSCCLWKYITNWATMTWNTEVKFQWWILLHKREAELYRRKKLKTDGSSPYTAPFSFLLSFCFIYSLWLFFLLYVAVTIVWGTMCPQEALNVHRSSLWF